MAGGPCASAWRTSSLPVHFRRTCGQMRTLTGVAAVLVAPGSSVASRGGRRGGRPDPTWDSKRWRNRGGAGEAVPETHRHLCRPPVSRTAERGGGWRSPGGTSVACGQRSAALPAMAPASGLTVCSGSVSGSGRTGGATGGTGGATEALAGAPEALAAKALRPDGLCHRHLAAHLVAREPGARVRPFGSMGASPGSLGAGADGCSPHAEAARLRSGRRRVLPVRPHDQRPAMSRTTGQSNGR